MCHRRGIFKTFSGQSFSPADMLVGVIYVTRDISQREVGHYVLLAMLVGAVLSYLLAAAVIALASVSGFVVGEIIDWILFSVAQKPLSQRLLISSLISAPIDTWIFLSVAHQLNHMQFIVIILGKFVGMVLVWLIWKYRVVKSVVSAVH